MIHYQHSLNFYKDRRKVLLFSINHIKVKDVLPFLPSDLTSSKPKEYPNII